MKYSTRAPVTFNPSLSQLSFQSFSDFDLRSLYAAIDVTAGVPIYLMGVPNYGYSAVDQTGSILTLQAPMAGLQATDIVAVTYDEGNDNLADLVALASAGVGGTAQLSPLPTVQNYMGMYVQAPRLEELLKMNFAAIRVLTRMVIADKQIYDGDVDTMLNDELMNPFEGPG